MKKFVSSFAIFIAALMLLLPAVEIFSDAAEVQSKEVLSQKLDFSDPRSKVVFRPSAAEFTELLSFEKLSEIEKQHINSILPDAFAYSDFIPQSNVMTEYADGIMQIYAGEYEYTAKNGEKVRWVPKTAVVSGKEYPLVHEEKKLYSCKVSGLENNGTAQIEIAYTCTVKIKAELADFYKNFTFSCAKELYEQDRNFKEESEKYKAYEQYKKDSENYELLKAKWENYQNEKKIYELKQKSYNDYLKAEEQYKKDCAVFEKYLSAVKEYEGKLSLYNQYLTDKKNYESNLVAYEKYLGESARADAVMTVFRSIFEYDGEGHQMYATLMGDTVDTVLENKDKLINVGKADPDDINNAGIATDNLRLLLSEYVKCTDKIAQFAYYKEHYTEIKNNFITLYGCLYSLFKNEAVVSALVSKGKFERYMQFVSQLYVISTGLDDETIRKEDWVIRGDYDTDKLEYIYHSFYEFLDKNQIPPDQKSNPADIEKMPEPVEKPVLPTPVEKPTKPAPVEKPIEPEKVLKPVPPTPVSKPTKPAPVTPCEKPANPNFSENQKSLIKAYENKTIKQRETGKDIDLSFKTSLSRPVALDRCFVTFYDYDGKTVLAEYELKSGDKIVFDKAAPERKSDDKYHYRFSGWVTDSGEKYELGEVKSSYTVLIADYEKTLRSYTVTWDFDGKITEEKYSYGEIPKYKGSLKKESDEKFTYEFQRWSDSLKPVKKDASYRAVFKVSPRKYKVTWKIGGKDITELYNYGDTPRFTHELKIPFDGVYTYEFIEWDKAPEPIKENKVFNAVVKKTAVAKSSDGKEYKTQILPDRFVTNVTGADILPERLLSSAISENKNLVLSFDGGKNLISLNEAAIKDLISKDCEKIVLIKTEKGKDEISSLSVEFYGKSGKKISLTSPFSLITECEGRAQADTVAYLNGEGKKVPIPSEFSDGKITVRLNSSAMLSFKNEHRIVTGEFENGLISAPEKALSGEKITLQCSFEEKYEFEFLKIIGVTTKKEYKYDENYSFIMPDESLEISAKLKLSEFKVEFISDGKVISSQIYHKGDIVNVPQDPTKADEGKFKFTFEGWSPVVTPVDGDTTYTAIFTKAAVGEQETYVPDSQNRFYLFIIEVFVALAVLIVAIVFLVKFIRKKLKNKKKNSGKGKSKEEKSE